MTELKTFSDLARMVELEQRAEAEQARLDRIAQKRAKQDEAVVGGVYRPDPVDRAAAMLLARAPWWAFAPNVKNDKEMDKEMNKEIKTNEKEVAGIMVSDLENGDGSTMETLMKILLKHIEEKTPQKIREVARAALVARESVLENIVSLQSTVNDLDRSMIDAVQNIRSSRMSIVSDASSVINSFRDIRQFFLGPDYEREQKRLVEFVDLCERLKLLKDSGFLDTVADTMIRLAAYDKES